MIFESMVFVLGYRPIDNLIGGITIKDKDYYRL